MYIIKIEEWPNSVEHQDEGEEVARIVLRSIHPYESFPGQNDWQISLVEWGTRTADSIVFNHTYKDGWFKLLKRGLYMLREATTENLGTK